MAQQEFEMLANRFIEIAQATTFRFLRVGPLCDASKSRSLTDARCDLSVLESDNRRYIYGTRMAELFQKGCDALENYIAGDVNLSLEEKRAISTLKSFLLEIGRQTTPDDYISIVQKVASPKGPKGV